MNIFEQKLQDIRKLVFGDVVPAPVAPVVPDVPTPVDYKLQDGSSVTIDKLEVGGIVLVAGEPAQDGELVLEDGSTLTVVGGVITEIESKAAQAAEPVDMSQFTDKVNEVEQKFEAYKAEQAELIAAQKEVIEKQGETLKAMFELVEQIAEQPAVEPLEKVKYEDMTPLQKFRASK